MPVQRSRVPLLVLAHLGILPIAACKEDTHVVEPVTIPSATATSTASASATATTTATASGTASALASAAATASGALKQGECRTDQDCGAPYMQCVLLAGNDKKDVGHCDYRKDYRLGRPLVVDGVAHVASYVGTISSAEGDELRRAAREEHASIAAFARTISELMALGAPTWLLFETQTALADEIRHTELTLDAVEHLTGERLVLGALPGAVLALRSEPDAAAALFRDVFRGGAVGETMAAAHAEEQRAAASTDELRTLYDTICVDEAKHAALAFKTLRWLLGESPTLARVLDEERARLVQSGSFEERTLVGPLLDFLS